MKRTSRIEWACIGALVVLFACFTWRGVGMFFSDDDLMNMYKAWTTPALKIWKAQVLPWMPIYRPLGTAVYRAFYAVFGFHPLPLYVFCWVLLAANVALVWQLFRSLMASSFEALLAVSLILVHGAVADVYFSAGTIYDRLCFLFTVLALLACARGWRGFVVMLLCLMALNSKESGAMLPLMLVAYELIYRRRVRSWIRYGAPGLMLFAFALGRMHGTPELNGNPAYQPHFAAAQWFSRVGSYLDVLSYGAVHPDAIAAGVVLAVLLGLAVVLRNRAMVFGWVFFVLAITPVALISMRPGYVLYVPEIGLGIYFAALIGAVVRPASQLRLVHVGALVLVTGATSWAHVAHWHGAPRVQDSSAWRLTEKMRRDYPTLDHGTRILFVDDFAWSNEYDAMFNLRLLYGDDSIEVAKLHSVVARPLRYDLVFTAAQESYVELDTRDVDESVRLHILRDYAPGRHFDTARGDGIGYVVSGVRALGRKGWWTAGSAKLKFDLYPADALLRLRFWVPDNVASGAVRHLSVVVGGETVGYVELTQRELNEVRFPVSSRSLNGSGFTIVELNVDDPVREGGEEFGVVLLSADFDYGVK